MELSKIEKFWHSSEPVVSKSNDANSTFFKNSVIYFKQIEKLLQSISIYNLI